MATPLAPEEAWRRIAAHASPRGTERRPRGRCLGRVLASSWTASTELPAHDVAALDGFALGGEPAAGATLAVAGTVAAGDAPGARLPPGAALRIWTGAPMPAGADRIVAIEDTEPAGDDAVRLRAAPPVGHAIRRRGEIARPGDALLARGTRLGAPALALAASQGLAEIEVVRAPRVAVLTTGDEVVPPELEPPPGGLRDSHTDYLLAAGARLGLELEPLGIARDDADELAARLGPALERCDFVLTCGGVSMGGADLLPSVLARLGCELDFHGVAIQPGKPLLFARRRTTLVFGLPGNPASVMVAFRLLVRPALERLLGLDSEFWGEAETGRLAGRLAAGRGRDRFVPARRAADGGLEPLPVRGSHDLVTFGAADRLLRVRAGAPERAPGDDVESIVWD